MNKKQRTLKALDALIIDVKNNDYEVRYSSTCKFCIIHYSIINSGECVGCPFASTYGDVGCFRFKLYSTLKNLDATPATIAQLEAMRHALNTIPAERFTRKGWKYFTELENYKK